MIITRRTALGAILAGAVAESALPSVLRSGWQASTLPTEGPALAHEPWDLGWDRAIIEGNLKRLDQSYDPQERMIRSYIGPEYNYQSQLRNTTVHPIRDTFQYALALLEDGDDGRAERAYEILERTLRLQDSNPASKWYGLWSYYKEEPLPKMGAVDFNWADFNGSLLLQILKRHGGRIPDLTKQKIDFGIRQACASIKRRDITPHYTNIVAMGSFVILAAAELLSDKDLLESGLERMRHWAEIVDESGSFTEYNSPTYTPVALDSLIGILTIVHNQQALQIAGRLERRAWQELATHWHAPTMQLAGPMSRAYSNDIGKPLWLQKSLDNRLVFQTKSEISENSGALSTALLPYRCPEDLRALFLELKSVRQHREVFVPSSILIDTIPSVPFDGVIAPVEGTTFLTPNFALGSCNRSDFWVQRRPLLGYWGGSERPPKWMQLRVLKDDYDFCSALFHSVQQEGMVLGAISFRTDGGDRHPLIDRIRDGSFTFQRIVAEMHFGGWSSSYKVLFDGKELVDTTLTLPEETRVSIDTGFCRIGLQFHRAVFTVRAEQSFYTRPKLEWIRDHDQAILRLTIIERPTVQLTQWQQIEEAVCGFTCLMSERKQSLAEFDAEFASTKLSVQDTGQSRTLTWADGSASDAHKLSVVVLRAPRPFSETERGYIGHIDGKPVPANRLSDSRIL